MTAETGFISRVHRGVSDALAVGDPVLAADYLRVFGDHMTPEDRAAAWQSLQGPLTQTQAVADLDTLAIARSATAPLTPHGDGDSLMRRMLAITPAAAGAGANVPTDLPEMLDRYGGDAAKAWAASEMGADAFDALAAKHGATWFGALPVETRNAVAANMAMLGAVASPRGAPADGGALAMEIEEQPWSEERKQKALDELNTRIGLDARRVKQAQDDAKESGLALADHLGLGFISINQLPPAMRANLGADALAALTLRADRNVHPVAVPAHGDVAMNLNRMAATDPETFAKEDLRLHRDEMTPAEYDALDRVQKAWSGYPPGGHAVTQQRSVERVRASGLDVDPASGTGDATVGRNTDQPIDIGTRMVSQPSQSTIGNDPGNQQLAPPLVPATYLRPVSGEAPWDNDGSPGAEHETPLLEDLGVATSPIFAAAAAPAQTAISGPVPLGTDLSTVDAGFGGLGHGVKGDYRTPPEALAWLQKLARHGEDDVSYPDGTPGSDGASVAARRKIRAEVAYLYTLPEVKAFLDALSFTEGTSGDGYFRSHWPSTEKLPDLKSFHGTVPSGRYQITLENWRNYGEGWWSRKDFSPISQDVVAITLLRQKDIIKDLMAGNLSGAFSKAATVFASIPMSSKKDYSVYIGGTKRPDDGPTTHPPRQLTPVRFDDLPALYVDRLNRRRQEFKDAKRAWETNKTVPYAFISPLKWQSFGIKGF